MLMFISSASFGLFFKNFSGLVHFKTPYFDFERLWNAIGEINFVCSNRSQNLNLGIRSCFYLTQKNLPQIRYPLMYWFYTGKTCNSFPDWGRIGGLPILASAFSAFNSAVNSTSFDLRSPLSASLYALQPFMISFWPFITIFIYFIQIKKIIK